MAKNPFVSFKNIYAGKDTVADDLTSSAQEQMGGAYEELYNAIYTRLSKARSEENYATVAKQTQLLKQVAVELDKFKTKTGSYLMKALKKVAEYGTAISIKDLELMSTGVTKADKWHYDYNRDYAEQTFKDSFEHIAAQTDKMKGTMKAQLKADSALIFRRSAVEGWSRNKAQKELEKQLTSTMPEFQFTDKIGRNWNTKSYLDMLTKTVMASTLNEVYLNTLINEGHDLVKVSQNGAKDDCLKWEGKVLSITGSTKGYPTVSEARATGQVFHPRCKHRMVVYNEEMDDIFNKIDEGMSDDDVLGFNVDDFLAQKSEEDAKAKAKKDKDEGQLQAKVDFEKKKTELLNSGLSENLMHKANGAIGLYNNGLINKQEFNNEYRKIKSLAYVEKEDAEILAFKEDNFQLIGARKGSNPGGLYEHRATGEKYYIKIPEGSDNEMKVKNEVLAHNLYKVAGVKVPDLQSMIMNDGKLAVVSKWEEGLNGVGGSSDFKKFHKGFAVDAWLANWDVAGMTFDNVAINKAGEPVRIDVGGSLLYRAQGGTKGHLFGDSVGELESLINVSMNPQSARLFNEMSSKDVLASMRIVAKVSDAKIKKAIADAGIPKSEATKLLKTIVERRNYIRGRVDGLSGKGKAKTTLVDDGPLDTSGIEVKYRWAYGTVAREDIDRFWNEFSPYKSIYSDKIEAAKKLYPTLTDEEAVAYVIYTNGHYKELNAFLREDGHDPSRNEHLSSYAKILNRAIHKATEQLPEAGRAQGPWDDAEHKYYVRKTSLQSDVLHNWKKDYASVGNKVQINSFLSTSRYSTSFDGNVHVYFKPKNGYAYCDKFSAHQGEDEIVVPFGKNVVVEQVIEPTGKYDPLIVYWKEI